MRQKEEKQIHGGEHKYLRVLHEGDPIYIRNYTNGTLWIPAKIVEVTGPTYYYKAQSLIDGTRSRRHIV